jgi:hypothetical protein
MIQGWGRRATSAVGVVVVVCLGARVAASLVGPLMPLLIGIAVVYAVVFGLVRRR